MANSNHRQAEAHLRRRDETLRQLIDRLGPCTLRPSSNYFRVLVHSIIAQQISTKAARSICTRLSELLKPRRLSAAAILEAPDEFLQSAGLSKSKRKALRDLAEKVRNRRLQLRQLQAWEDNRVIAELSSVHGIGRWTAEMFLIFGLGREDVLPVADFGLRAAVRNCYALPELPTAAQLLELSEPWQPYRTVATWYFWRSLGNVPQS